MQDQKMQIKAQATQLCKMLSKPNSQRMPFQGVQIAKTLQRISFLSRFFDMKSQQFIHLCITSNIVQFPAQTSVYSSQSLEQRFIYIILDGRVKVNLKSPTDEIYEQSPHYLDEFGVFGQTQILFSLPARQQQFFTEKSAVKCMVFEQGKINKILNIQMMKFTERSFKYLQANQYFEEMTVFEKQQLVLNLTLRHCNKGDIVIEQQSDVSQVLFIVHGSISVVRNLPTPGTSSSIAPFKIDELSEMDSYSQYQCINNKKSSHTLIANTSLTLYYLDFSSIRQTNHRILQLIRQKAVPYPDEKELMFLMGVKDSLKEQINKTVKKNKLFG